MVYIAICDDNINELTNIVRLINEYRTSKHLNCNYVTFQNGFDLIFALEKGKRFDFYCLNIIMPAYMGIDLARGIRTFDKNAPILFYIVS